jgi:hypothetical protein
MLEDTICDRGRAGRDRSRGRPRRARRQWRRLA